MAATGNACAEWSSTGQVAVARLAAAAKTANLTAGLEVHERWAYDDRTRIQALRRVICLCTDRHPATHYGLASLTGKDGEAFSTSDRAVTGLPSGEVDRQIEAAFELWQERSLFDWELDLRILAEAGIHPHTPSLRKRAR